MILFLDKLDILSSLTKVSADKKKISKKRDRNFNGIVVVFNQDTFSSSRSKVVIANALSFVWNVPVVGVARDEFTNKKELLHIVLKKLKKTKVGKFILPIYNKEPNIT